MKLSLDIKTSLTQTLTPQQIQYLKLLQLPLIQLEQNVRQEVEQNPMLEEFGLDEPQTAEDSLVFSSDEKGTIDSSFENGSEDKDIKKSQFDDQKDPFEFYKMIWQDDNYNSKAKSSLPDDDDNEPFQIKDNVSFVDELIQQLRLLDLTTEELYLGEQIIGNIDTDGYLRRDLSEITDETNSMFAEVNMKAQIQLRQDIENQHKEAQKSINPARKYAISDDAKKLINSSNGKDKSDYIFGDIFEEEEEEIPADTTPEMNTQFLKPVTTEQAEHVLLMIRHLDPPGIGSRTIKECLLAQAVSFPKKSAAQKLAVEILDKTYDAFVMKHYNVILKQLEVGEDYLKEAIEFIRRLNPRPGGGDYQSEMNTVIPDFMIEYNEERTDLTITVNDSRIPALQLSKAYEKLKKEAKFKLFNKETREWIRSKYDDAKFLIQALRQRKNTMLKVMTAIAYLQRDFFDFGSSGLRPLIYKDVAEKTGLDISTVCRIVNGKYVQTEFGTHELKYFFSESLPNEDGDEISTTVIKNIIKDIIDAESKKKPLSDDKISQVLKEKGYHVARRTVAKYREQMKIPVARLRKEL